MAYAKDANASVGTVRQSERRIVELTIHVDMLSDDVDESAEYVITLDGRPLRRMSGYQFGRLVFGRLWHPRDGNGGY